LGSLRNHLSGDPILHEALPGSQDGRRESLCVQMPYQVAILRPNDHSEEACSRIEGKDVSQGGQENKENIAQEKG
jgi:hypothetical protein